MIIDGFAAPAHHSEWRAVGRCNIARQSRITATQAPHNLPSPVVNEAICR